MRKYLLLTLLLSCLYYAAFTQDLAISFLATVPEISISDPCICKNNATTLGNGQFGETITIQSSTGETWVVTSVSGLYAINSPAPPNAPTPIPVGTTFTETPDSSGIYLLRGVHIDALGYTLTASNQSGVVRTISNTCRYPNPVVTTDLNASFCLFSKLLELKGNPGDSLFQSAGFTINGLSASVFDPGTLGIGQYNIVYTVDGGQAQAADPGCIQSVQALVQVLTTPATLVCNDQVQVSLDSSCSATITPDMVLEGTYGCFDDYSVSLSGPGGQPLGNTVQAANIGQTLTATVTHLNSGNTCWGLISIEDKLPPVLTCSNFAIPCVVSHFEPAYLKNTLGFSQATPQVNENCSGYNLTFSDFYTDEPCSTQGISAQLLRVWTAEDAYGNQGNCIQTIQLKRIELDDIELPSDTAFDCTKPQFIPDSTGTPIVMINGIPFSLFPNQSACELQIVYTDQFLPVCDGSYKILRTWTLLNWCLPAAPDTNPIFHIQVIKINDQTAPTFTCPANVTVSTDANSCARNLDLEDVLITDLCSQVNSIRADWTANGYPFALIGSISDFAGNNYWNADTLGVLGSAYNLPKGSTIIRYMVTDDCGNSRVCTFTVTIEDQTQPVAACDKFTQVSLGLDGSVLINAESFDDGSYDNCNDTMFKARRISTNSCQPNNRFFDQVRFCCEDAGDTVQVLLRVFDSSPPVGDVSLTFMETSANDCMVHVFIDDKTRPSCQAPDNVTVSCENFDIGLTTYGDAIGADNCCLDTLTVINNTNGFDDQCSRGTILRTFRVTDCGGLSTQCTQRILVTHDQDYYIRFPNDIILTTCDSTNVYDEPVLFGEDCELLGMSFQDKVFTVVPDACYKIERTWKIINWCTYDPNAPCINVPNPEPNAIINSSANLPGPTVSPLGTSAPWAPSVVKIRAADPTATNFSTFWNAGANCYTYKQVIKIIDSEDPVIDTCRGPLELCDISPNDPFLWNTNALWDPLTQQHDLCEAPAGNLSVHAVDDCSGSDVHFRYLLFLDTDQDGDMETVVSSANLPGYNNIQVGNAQNPNYSGGTPLAFDNRPVPANQRFGFALQVTQTGASRTARVAWNTAQSPGTFFDPQLPYGRHKIKWIVSDNCGNETVCEYPIETKDCKAPTVVCLNGLSVNLMPNGMINLWASDFLQYGNDNCTPANKLIYGIRQAGAGTGFPRDAQGNPIDQIAFTCVDVGMQEVELWSEDLAGNADYCLTFINIQDNAAVCTPGAPVTVAGNLFTAYNKGVDAATITLSYQAPPSPAFQYVNQSGNGGHFQFSKSLPLASTFTVTPSKDDNPLNGVSTYDLVLMSRHILGQTPIQTPYAMIAADINNSGSITTFDIVELRKLILGVYTTFPVNTSWRFVPQAFNFPNAFNPFESAFPEQIADTLPHVNGNYNFVGIKVGDVNGNAIVGASAGAQERSNRVLRFDLTDQIMEADTAYTLTLKPVEDVLGYQFTLKLNGLELIEILPGKNMSADNFAVFRHEAGTMLTVSAEIQPGTFELRVKASASGKLSRMLEVSSQITRAEAYGPDGVPMDVMLHFNTDTSQRTDFELYQNQPNPFTDKTSIGFYLPEAGSATLSVLDDSGRLLFSQTAAYAKGYNTITINRSLLPANGLLFYRLATAADQATRTMMVIGQ